MCVLLPSSHHFNRLERYIKMKKTCSQIKDAARPCLFGQYGTLIAAFLVIELITMLVSIPFAGMVNIGIQYTVISQIVIGYAGALIVSVVSYLFESGILYMHLRLAHGEKISFSHILYCLKNHPDRYLGFALIMLLVSVLPVLPGMICFGLAIRIQQNTALAAAMAFIAAGTALCAAGIVAVLIIALSLSQTTLLMLDDPELALFPAMRQSRQLMRRNKWRLFVLYLSFIGWGLLGLVSLGIGLLWIEQYVEQSIVQFYLDVRTTESI